MATVAVASLLGGGYFFNAIDSTETAAPASIADSQHASLLPVDIISIAYTSSLTGTCSDGPANGNGTHILSWSFDASDLGAPGGVSISSATSADVDTSLAGGVVTADSLGVEINGNCNSDAARNFVGTVTGTTSNGDTYTMTLNGTG